MNGTKNQEQELLEDPLEHKEWKEQDLAVLAGFEDGYTLQPESNSGDARDDLNPIEQSDLFEEVEDPHEAKTKPTLSGNPYAKAAVVGVALMGVFGIGGFFLTQISGADFKKAPSLIQANQKPKLEKKPESEPVGEDVGTLKTELAISSQEKQIKAVEKSRSPRQEIKTQKPHSQPTPSTTTATTSTPSPPPPPSPYTYTPPPRRIASPPVSYARVTPPMQSSPLPVPSPPETLPPPRVSSQPPKPEPTAPETTETGLENWQMLARLGSYGTTVQEVSESAVTTKEITQTEAGTIPVIETVAIAQNSRSTVQFQVGQLAIAKTITPIIWVSSEDAINQRFVVQLDEPITSANGWELLPVGTQIVMTCQAVHDSGMVDTEAIAIIKDGVEYQLPPDTISIRGESGQPLIASHWNSNSGEVARRDLKVFLFGALSKVGEVLNQPDSQSSTTTSGSGFSQTSSITSGDPNFIGAVLEGGFTPLTEQIKERNEQALDELLERENIWYVPADQPVQVFVNKSFYL
ncbi:MAG TPA: hypothetical protein DD379_13150 [Cyanobacteria bacterium UBA11162]|nr:hypothetical protein [Cyanobacteria bacterium UBA11162]